MAKAKNPKRVKAAKAAYARAKREGTGLFKGTKKKASSTKNPGGGSTGSKKAKLPSLANSVTMVGGAIVITGLGVDARDRLIGEMDSMLDVLGLGVTVTGIGIVAVAHLLKAAASVSKWFGRKYRGYLRGYGLRP